MVKDSILRSFQTIRQMLDRCRYLTSIIYPNWPDLMARMTHANKLTIAKLDDGGWVMTDTCNDKKEVFQASSWINQSDSGGGGHSKEANKVFEAGKVITNVYSIFFSTLTLHDCNLFTIILFCILLATSTQCLVRICHHKTWQASSRLDEDGSVLDPFLSAHHH